MQPLDAKHTCWYVSFGTHGSRPEGAGGPGAGLPAGAVRTLTTEQRVFIQEQIPVLCNKGGWRLRGCAAGPQRVEVLLDARRSVHGNQIRQLLKRWLTQVLDAKWPRPDETPWWAEGGSIKPQKEFVKARALFMQIQKHRASL